MRSKEEIYKDMRKAQAEFDAAGLDVAMLKASADASPINRNKVLVAMNMKADELKRAELWLRKLEEELANSK